MIYMKEYLQTNYNLDSDDLVEVIDELPLWSAPFGLKLLDKIIYRKNITVLDIGFGTGFPLIEVAMRLGESCKVYGIDPWKAAANRARRKIRMYQLNNVELIEGYAEEIPLGNDSVDLIISNNGINNVTDIEKVFSECYRITKSGGQFLVSVNLNNTMIEFYEIYKSILAEKKMHSEVEKMQQHIYSKRKPLEEFKEQIINSGFKIKEVEQSKFEIKFVDGTAMLNHHFIKLAFLNSWKNIIPEDKQDKIFNELEKSMNNKSAAEGLFKLSVPFVVVDCIK